MPERVFLNRRSLSFIEWRQISPRISSAIAVCCQLFRGINVPCHVVRRKPTSKQRAAYCTIAALLPLISFLKLTLRHVKLTKKEFRLYSLNCFPFTGWISFVTISSDAGTGPSVRNDQKDFVTCVKTILMNWLILSVQLCHNTMELVYRIYENKQWKHTAYCHESKPSHESRSWQNFWDKKKS